MNTLIVLAGLMLIVPRTDPSGQITSLTVLVLDTQHAGPQLGQAVTTHQTDVTNLGGIAHVDLTGQWTIRSSAAGPIQMQGDDRFLILRKIYDKDLPPLRDGCLDADFASKCKLNGRPLVKAQLTFTGGWRLRPVEIDALREPRADVVDDSYWGFLQIPPGGLPLTTHHQVQLSSGLVLEPLSSGTVTFQGPGSQAFASLTSIPEKLCVSAVGFAGKCEIVRFLNTVNRTNTEGDHLEIDVHHNMLYDLYDPAPIPRYLLFIRKDGSSTVMATLGYNTGGGGTPGIRPCIPGAFAAAVPLP
jgi:hypothetical protein